MLKWLEDRYGERASKGDKASLINMRSEAARLECLIEQQKDKTRGNTEEDPDERGSEDETESDVSLKSL
jgi:hypothetical protein